MTRTNSWRYRLVSLKEDLWEDTTVELYLSTDLATVLYKTDHDTMSVLYIVGPAF